MPFFLDQFGPVALPLFEAQQDVSSGTSLSAFRQLQEGGAYRVRGTERAMRQMQRITTNGAFVSDQAVDLAVLARALYAERGTLAKLYRREYGTAARHWCWAELVRVGAEISPQTARPRQFVQPVAPEFQMVSPSWYGKRHGPPAWLWGSPDAWGSGVAWDQAAGDTFDLPSIGTATCVVHNDGNAPIDNARLHITVSAFAPMLVLEIESVDPSGRPAAHLTYTGTIGSGSTLIIDCGARSVTLDGTSRYGDFAVGDDHALAGWLRLYPGTTTLTLTYGEVADGQLQLEFHDGHE